MWPTETPFWTPTKNKVKREKRTLGDDPGVGGDYDPIQLDGHKRGVFDLWIAVEWRNVVQEVRLTATKEKGQLMVCKQRGQIWLTVVG